MFNDTIFKGFAPRWILPMMLRNVTNPARNTSCILMIIDSEREVDLDFGTGFSTEIIGDSEMMISAPARRHLDVSDFRKEQLELYFDIVGSLSSLSEIAGTSEHEVDPHVRDEVSATLRNFLPSTKDLIALLKD